MSALAVDAAVSPNTLVYTTVARVAMALRVAAPASVAEEGESAYDDWVDVILSAQEDVDRITGHAWRERRVTEEYATTVGRYPDRFGFVQFPFRRRHIKTLSSGSSDKLEVREGSTWVDYVASKTEGIGGDYWVQADLGIGHLRRRFLPLDRNSIRLTYRYGDTSVPRNVERATTLLAAYELALNETHGGGGDIDRVSLSDRVRHYKENAHRLLAPLVEVR